MGRVGAAVAPVTHPGAGMSLILITRREYSRHGNAHPIFRRFSCGIGWEVVDA